MAELRIVSGPGGGRVVSLEANRAVRIGRGAAPASPEEGSEHVQIEDKRLSRVHCEVACSESGWLVRDLGSSNGTFVNGERVTERALAPGDLVQVGGTIFEVAGLDDASSERPVVDSYPDASHDALLEPSEARPALPPPPRRIVRRSRSSSAGAIGYAVFAAGACLAAWVGYSVLQTKKGDPEPSRNVVTQVGQTAPRADAPGRADRPADAGSLEDDSALSVDVPLRAGDYRQAIRIVEETLKGPLASRAGGLRKKVEDAAVLALADRLKEAERLTAAGEYAAARSALEDLRPRLPDDLAAEIDLALDRLQRLEAGSPKSVGAAAPTIAKRSPPVARPSKRLVDLQASFQQLSANEATPQSAWGSLRDEVGAFARENRSEASFSAQREQLRSLFCACAVKSQDAARVRACFSARTAACENGRLTLSYDFASDEQLRDFHAVGPGSTARREGGSLVLRGECRMFGGEPFEGSLTVRGKIGADGYDAKAPNINVALFTREGARLTDDQKAAPSLFLAFVRGKGPEPNDFAAFCLGYRAVTANYDGKLLEQITPEGSTDPIQMPVHAVLIGKRGSLIHSDARECLWAVPSGGAPVGPVAFEISLDGDGFAWKVNGKPLVDAKDARLVRLRGLSEPSGSVTLFTRRSEVRFTSIQIEGRLSQAWLLHALGKSADSEFEGIVRE